MSAEIIQNQKLELPYLVLAISPGAANCLSPVVEGLLAKNWEVTLIAEDTAKAIFKDKFSPSNIADALPESTTLKRQTIIASGTFDPDFEGKIIEQVKRASPGSRLVLIEDFPGSLVSLMQKLASFEVPISPDLIFVTSRSSQRNMAGRFPDFSKDNIIPVGQPAFDSLLPEKTHLINDKVRASLQIQPGDLLVTYSGVPSQDHNGLNAQALGKTVLALNYIADRAGRVIYLLNRNHPREADPQQFEPILKAVHKRVKVIDEPQHVGLETREVTAASNLIVTTISTTGLETALRGSRPQTELDHTGWLPVHILLPQAQEYISRTAGSLPVTDLGATGVALKTDEVESTLELSLFDRDFKQRILDAQQGALRNEYRFYGERASIGRVLLWLGRCERNTYGY